MKMDVKFTDATQVFDTSMGEVQRVTVNGVDFKPDKDTLTLENGILSVNTTDAAAETDPRPITAQGVYNELAVINALLKTI